MKHKYLVFCAAAVLAANALLAQNVNAGHKTLNVTPQASSLELNNQMMMAFFERIKIGRLNEAREIAEKMTANASRFASDAATEYKSFYSLIEKEYYILTEAKQGKLQKEVIWVEQPIADGYYLQSVIDFQQNNHEKALANLQRAIFWNPVHSAYYAERGFMLLNKSSGADVLMARVAYLKAIELADNPEDFVAAMRGMSFIYLNSNRLPMALACLKAANNVLAGDDKVAEDIFEIQRLEPKLAAEMTYADAKKLLEESKIPYTYTKEHIEVLKLMAKKQKDENRALALLKQAQKLSPSNQDLEKLIKEFDKK